MPTELDDLLPKADDLMKKIAEAEAEKASEYMTSRRKLPVRRRHCWISF